MPKWNILVVEDDYSLQQLYKLEFEDAGLGITLASDGLEACKLLMNCHFDLVVTDIRMPRAGGESVMDCVEWHRTGVPVVVVSAYPQYQAKFKDDHRTLVGYFNKPVDFKAVIDHIRSFLENREHLMNDWKG